MERINLLINVIIWYIAIIYILRYQWKNSTLSVGVPFAFIFFLAVQYLFGAITNIFPWYSPPQQDLVILGFEQVTYGIIFFSIGVIILSPLIAKAFCFSWLKVPSRKPDFGLAQTYIHLGLLFWFVLTPLFMFKTSVGALVTSGKNLLLIGLCLLCWQSWLLKDKKSLIRWLILMGLLPIITIFTAGYASGAMLLVFTLSFVLYFYRPHHKAIMAAFLAIYLGLSLFVTYYRDRAEIRTIVWGGSHIERRIEQFAQSATSFEFFDPFNIRHLNSINERLNENIIAGEAISYMSTGEIPYAQGETIIQSFSAAIPRILWKNKPIFFGGSEFYAKYTGINHRMLEASSGNTSIAVGLPFEFYVNFGTLGVLGGFLILGVIFGLADIAASVRLLSGDWRGFMSWYLPIIAAISGMNDLAEMISNTSATVVLVFILNRVKIPRFTRRKSINVNS